MFSDNSTGEFGVGGGMWNLGSSPTLTNCMFSGNSTGEYGVGGGMVNHESSPTLTNCTFSGNSAGEYGGGGGMCNTRNSNPTLTNCTFSENSAEGGGGMFNWEYSNPKLTNCLFNSNSVNYFGGGMFNVNSSPTVTNCILWGNSAQTGPQIYNVGTGSVTVSYTDVQGTWPGTGNINADPCFVKPEYLGPISYWKFDESEGAIAYDSAGDNDGTIYGAQRTGGQIDGALSFDGDDYVNIPDSASFDITGDEITVVAWFKPGATRNNNRPIVSKWLGSDSAYVLWYKTDSVDLIGFGVKTDVRAAGAFNSTPVNDTNKWYHLAGVYDGSYITVYVDGVAGAPVANTGNINNSSKSLRISGYGEGAVNPHHIIGLVDDVRLYDRALSAGEVQQHYENGLSGHGYPDAASADYHLLPTSPCIDAGDNWAVPADTTDLDGDGNTTEPIPFDLDGNPRIVGDAVDMGAYELLTPQQLVINRTEEAIAEKEEALQKIDVALEKELEAYETLGEILESGDYGDWTRQAILGARWKISIAILYDEDYIKKVLGENIDKLQLTLSVLGIEPGQGNNSYTADFNTGAYEAAALSLHQLVINLIEEALAEKAEALEIVDAALEKERKAYEILEQMLESGGYGDWNRLDILRAKSRIYVAIKYEEYLKKVLMIMTVDKLEDSLSVLAVEPDVGSG